METGVAVSDPSVPEQDAPDAAQSFVLAETYYGETKPVTRSELFHRVSAYAVIIENEKILLIKTHNHRYYFPGGGVDVGEALSDAVKREAREELNADIQVGDLMYADDMIYYHDPVGRAAHLIRLFYDCRLLTRDFTQANAVERDEILSIEWVSLRDARASDFLPSTWRVLNGIKERMKEYN
jgi:8-oxo-dGTP pyrophosphatase MutT (NUDIX family)